MLILIYRLEKEDDDSIEDKNTDNWEVEIMPCPQQANSSDCGVCVCLNTNLLACDRPLEYSCVDGAKYGSRKKRQMIKEALIRGSLNDENDSDLAMLL